MEGKYLTFILGNEEYGIKLNTDYILGMANLANHHLPFRTHSTRTNDRHQRTALITS
jgi:hypothetical protein